MYKYGIQWDELVRIDAGQQYPPVPDVAIRVIAGSRYKQQVRNLDGEGDQYDEPDRRTRGVFSHHDHQADEDQADDHNHTTEPGKMRKGDHHEQIHHDDDQGGDDQAATRTLRRHVSDHHLPSPCRCAPIIDLLIISA